MTRTPLLASAATTALLGLCLPGQAEQIFNEDVIVDGGLCAGDGCSSGSATFYGLVIDSVIPQIIFRGGTPNFPSNPVTLHGGGSFRVQLAPSVYPFTIDVNAPDNAVMVDPGAVGLGVETPARELHIVDGQDTTIRLEQDTSDGQPRRIWDIEAGNSGFVLADIQNATVPFHIDNAAPASAFRLTSAGNIGFGTSLPQRELHVVDGSAAVLRLEQDTSGGFGHHTWDLSSGDAGFLLSDVGSIFSTVPFRVENGALNSALILSSNGNIGMGPGAATPAAALHLHRNLGNAQMLIEEVNATANPRTLLNLQNNGRPEIVMGNTATNGEWSFGAGTDFFLKTGTVGSTSGAKTKVFTVKGNGDAIVAGTLTTGGTTCGGGCDRVFTDRAVIPAETYAAQMWSQGHLPHVGPTVEGAPLNVSEKLGGLLNAVEHAHVFIDAQRIRDQEQQAEIARLKADKAAQDARIARLEARLAALVAER